MVNEYIEQFVGVKQDLKYDGDYAYALRIGQCITFNVKIENCHS